MAIFYLDTSAVLKRYRTEKGTDVVTELYEDGDATHDVLLSSHFTCLEFESVAARALSDRLLNQQAYDALLGAFSQDLGKYLLLLSCSGDIINDAVLDSALQSPAINHRINRGRRSDSGERQAHYNPWSTTCQPWSWHSRRSARKARAAQRTESLMATASSQPRYWQGCITNITWNDWRPEP